MSLKKYETCVLLFIKIKSTDRTVALPLLYIEPRQTACEIDVGHVISTTAPGISIDSVQG